MVEYFLKYKALKNIKARNSWPGLVISALRKGKAGRLLYVEASLSYTVRSCLKRKEREESCTVWNRNMRERGGVGGKASWKENVSSGDRCPHPH